LIFCKLSQVNVKRRAPALLFFDWTGLIVEIRGRTGQNVKMTRILPIFDEKKFSACIYKQGPAD
jgi:hypothetical protein